MFFLGAFLKSRMTPTSVVVVHAHGGVELLRWMPVFMYASLSYITYIAFVPRSTMPDRACMPMSAVPPSPAQPMTVTSLTPRASRAARMPDMDAPVTSKAVLRWGMSKHVLGKTPGMTAQQQAGMLMMVLGPVALRV